MQGVYKYWRFSHPNDIMQIEIIIYTLTRKADNNNKKKMVKTLIVYIGRHVKIISMTIKNILK